MKFPRATLGVLLVVLAPAAMLYPLWSDPVSAGEDDVIFYYPLRKRVGQALRQGRLPIRNELEATGMGLLADPQAAVLYPPTWLFALPDARLAYSLTLMLAFSLAGGGAWLYLRRLGLIRPAACLGTVAFMFCGFLVGHRVHWSVLHAAAWLPWGLWCIEGLRSRPAAAFAWMVPVAFLTLTAGHWPTLIHVGLIWSAYLLLRGRPFWRSATVAAVAMVLAAAIAAPQIDGTRRLLAHATRHRIGFATAGENSFYPPTAVLALFPMIFGTRTPNLYTQAWWGPWHLCEMLGYVGLATLVLAGAAVWSLYRKRPPPRVGDGPDPAAALRPVVRAWTWLAVGAGVWMIGYYLPTYRLIHMLPVLGVVRCPARMVVAVDMALATLAAVAVHTIAAGPSEGDARAASLRRGVLRGSTFLLPAAMVAVLLLTAGVALVSRLFLGGQLAFFNGNADDALRAVAPTNPAVWVPLGLMVATVLAVRWWLGSPRRRAGALVALLLADLFFVTRFVDVPGAGAPAPDPDVSPAAEWLARNAPPGRPPLVWGLGLSYNDRPAELLRPKTAQALGIATINSYGPFQSPAHAHLLGFRIFGTNRDWPWQLRRNYLLSLYGVRYILAADRSYRDVIDSIRIPREPNDPDGPDVLSGEWWLDSARLDGDVLRLRTPVLWHWSIAKQPVKLAPEAIYRIALDARGPDDGAANFLRAELFQGFPDNTYRQADEWGLTVYPEQMGTDWRHFEWAFRAPRDLAGQVLFRVFTMSERTIEVRNIRLAASHWPVPLDPGRRLQPGQRVYELKAELPAVATGGLPVAIYENRLCPPALERPAWLPSTPNEIERLKWHVDAASIASGDFRLPDVGLAAGGHPWALLCLVSLPTAALYALTAALALVRSRRRRGE